LTVTLAFIYSQGTELHISCTFIYWTVGVLFDMEFTRPDLNLTGPGGC